MIPFEGDDRFTSAMIVTLGRLNAPIRLGALLVFSARSRSSSREERSVAARDAASSVNSPRVPVGFVQSGKACASVDLRLTYEFGKCSVETARRFQSQTTRGKRICRSHNASGRF